MTGPWHEEPTPPPTSPGEHLPYLAPGATHEFRVPLPPPYGIVTSGPITPGPPTPPAPRGRRRVFRWVFLAVQALFVVWIIAGAASTSGTCDGKTGDALHACQTGTAAGTTIGVALIIFLWAAIDVILGVTYLIVRRRS